jgi:iron complex transport system substrate-binding protein
MTKIVSLLPSATEIVCGLGSAAELVGVSHECDFPDRVTSLPRVTKSLIPEGLSSQAIDDHVRSRMESKQSLYGLDIDLLKALEPDLIVTQSLCDVCAVSEDEVRQALSRLGRQPQVVHLSPSTLTSVFENIREIADAAELRQAGEELIARLEHRVDQVRQRSIHVNQPLRVVMLEWLSPLFSAGHWNPELIGLAGGREMLGRAGQKSTQISWDQIRDVNPELLMVSACGFSLPRVQSEWNELEGVPDWIAPGRSGVQKLAFVDGSSYFNRPGPRLIDSLEIAAHLIAPDVHPAPPAGGFLVAEL